MITLVRSMWEQARAAQAEARERKRLFKVALAFNQLHAYPRLRRWMCPECNKTHESTGYSALTGLHYPACCSANSGHRHWKEHATGAGL
jgi:hypothetical protein